MKIMLLGIIYEIAAMTCYQGQVDVLYIDPKRGLQCTTTFPDHLRDMLVWE